MERTFLMNKTTKKAERITSNQFKEVKKYGIPSSCYINPQEISGRINYKIRTEKDAEQELWKELLEKAAFDMPGASDSKLQAIVFK